MTDYDKLVKALTCGNDGKLPCDNQECPYWVDRWHGIGLCNVIIKDEDAAAAIEALQAQLPKLGKWEPVPDPEGRPYKYVCSNCHRFHVNEDEWYGYCPNCGAKMEVQE